MTANQRLQVSVAARPNLSRVVRRTEMKRYVPMIFLFGVLTGCGYNAQDAFRKGVMDPMPASVKILKADSHVGFDTTVWLHFSVDPTDAGKILQADKWEEDHNPSLVQVGKTPAWWDAQKLGTGVRLFQTLPDKNKGNYWIKTLYMNATSNEIYCLSVEAWR